MIIVDIFLVMWGEFTKEFMRDYYYSMTATH